MLSLLLLSMVLLAIGITLILLARLFRSCPVIFIGVFVLIVASVLCFVDDVDQPIMGVLWSTFSLISVVFGALWLIKNKRWAFWFSFGADIGLLTAAIYQYPFSKFLADGTTDKYVRDLFGYDGSKIVLEKYGLSEAEALAEHSRITSEVFIHVLVPFLVFLAVGFIGNLIFNLIVPKMKHQSRNERKHLTNVDPIIGKRVTISKDREDGHSQRGFIGDVDWSIEPLYGYETFKVGDVVKVVSIKGVTLLCTRDGKDYRAEMRRKHKEEAAKQRIEDEKLRIKRAQIKASRMLEAEKRRIAREEERAKRIAELRKVKAERDEQLAKQKAELNKIRAQRKAIEDSRKSEEKKQQLAAKAELEKMKLAKKAEQEKAALEKQKAKEQAKLASKQDKEKAKIDKKADKEKEALDKAKAKEEAKLALEKAKAEELAKKHEEKTSPKKVEEKKEAKPAPEKKKETVVKEKVVEKTITETCKCNKHKYDVIYYISSTFIVLCCIAFIYASIRKPFPEHVYTIQYIFLALIISYLLLIFILEIFRAKARKQARLCKEEKVVETVTETVVEEKTAEPEAQASKEKAEFVPFAVRLAQSDDFAKEAYNELKSEVLSYGIKSRVSSTGDTFRLHTKAYVKMVVAGKFLKLYFALDPKDYKNSTYPFEDASRMDAHKDTPFVFKIKSGLSVRRAKTLISDAAKKDNLKQGEVVKHNHFADLQSK